KKFDKLEDLMGLFGRKSADGIGFGSDEKNGIDREIKLVVEGKSKVVAKNAPLYEDMAYSTAAIGMIAEIKAPAKDQGDKKRADWIQWSQHMQEKALVVAKAAQ